MEAYSDGVFSIAGTLLVLDIALNPPGTAMEQVLHAWPAYLGYLISFLTIGAAWIGHSAMTGRLTHVDRSLLGINLMLLLVVAFLLFPTKLIADGLGDQNGERVFVTIYGLTLLTIRLISFLLDVYARHERFYSAPENDDEVDEDRREILPVLALYGLAIVLGLAAPKAAVGVYLVLVVFLVVPFRDVRRLLFSRR